RLLAGAGLLPRHLPPARSGPGVHQRVRVPARVERVHPGAGRTDRRHADAPAVAAVLPAGPARLRLGRGDGRVGADRRAGDDPLRLRTEPDEFGIGLRGCEGLISARGPPDRTCGQSHRLRSRPRVRHEAAWPPHDARTSPFWSGRPATLLGWHWRPCRTGAACSERATEGEIHDRLTVWPAGLTPAGR